MISSITIGSSRTLTRKAPSIDETHSLPDSLSSPEIRATHGPANGGPHMLNFTHPAPVGVRRTVGCDNMLPMTIMIGTVGRYEEATEAQTRVDLPGIGTCTHIEFRFVAPETLWREVVDAKFYDRALMKLDPT